VIAGEGRRDKDRGPPNKTAAQRENPRWELIGQFSLWEIALSKIKKPTHF